MAPAKEKPDFTPQAAPVTPKTKVSLTLAQFYCIGAAIIYACWVLSANFADQKHALNELRSSVITKSDFDKFAWDANQRRKAGNTSFPYWAEVEQETRGQGAGN